MNSSSTRIDWDVDVVKHYVRRHAWLPAARSQRDATRGAGRQVTYLTFCAAQALDVFLFLKEGILTRDPETDVVSNAYFCEQKSDIFQEISELIGPHDQGFLGNFQEMILFADDEVTRGRRYDDRHERYESEMRKRLDIKQRHERFRNAMPFDIINLDICGTMFPPAGGVHSPMIKSIDTLLRWQADCCDMDDRFRSFTLFLTTHIEAGRVNEQAFRELVAMVENNGRAYAGYADGLQARFGRAEVSEIARQDFNAFYCLALPKAIVSRAFHRGWLVEPSFSGLHRRVRRTDDGRPSTTYSMLSWVGRFTRYDPSIQQLGRLDTPGVADYARVIRSTTTAPSDVDEAVGEISGDVAADLASVVERRRAYQERHG